MGTYRAPSPLPSALYLATLPLPGGVSDDTDILILHMKHAVIGMSETWNHMQRCQPFLTTLNASTASLYTFSEHHLADEALLITKMK